MGPNRAGSLNNNGQGPLTGLGPLTTTTTTTTPITTTKHNHSMHTKPHQTYRWACAIETMWGMCVGLLPKVGKSNVSGACAWVSFAHEQH